MKWTYWRLDVVGTRPPALFRTDDPYTKAVVYQEWDPETAKWVDMPFDNFVRREINFGSGDVVKVSHTDVAAVDPRALL